MDMKKEYLQEAYLSTDELPQKVRIDASTVCQLKCPSCYMRKHPEKVKKGCGTGYLKFEDFKTFVDLNPHIKKIEFSNSGEIFLNPDLIKIMEYAYSKNIKQTAKNGANLNYLTDEQAEALVKYQFAEVSVSLDGASQETYSKYRIGGNYDRVIENIKKIIYYKNLYKSYLPKIIWNYIVFGHNEHEIPKAKIETEKLSLTEIYFKPAWNDDFPIQDVEFVKKETGIQNINIFSSPIEQLKDYIARKINWFPCCYLWDAPQINWDGQVLGCCCNYEDRFAENALKQDLLTTLNSEKIIYAKNMIKGKAPENKNIPCYNCHIYKAMKDTNLYLPSLR